MLVTQTTDYIATNILWDGEAPPEDWKKATVIPSYKKKDVAKIAKTIEELVC
jgi:hypothetical protein